MNTLKSRFVNPPGQLVLCVAHNVHRAGFSVSGRNQDWYLGLATSGGFHYNGDDGQLDLAAGDLLMVRPGTFHRWVAYDVESDDPAVSPNAGIFWSIFRPRPHWSEYLHGPEELPGFIRHKLTAAACRRTRRCLELALRSYHWAGPHREKWIMLSLERALLGIHEEVHHFASPDLHVQRALDFIHKNVGRALTLEEIAAASHISVSFLIRLFKRQVGVTPIAYVEQLRLQRATELLRNSHYPIAQIATLLGYEHPAYFGQRFRKATGLTPRAYREEAMQTIAAKGAKGGILE